MIKVCIEYAEPGMVLAKNLQGLDGSTVLESGANLDPETIARLMDMGVGHVFIKPSGRKEDEELLAERCLRYVRNFFLYVDPDHPAMAKLYELSAGRAMTALRDGWSIPCRNEFQAKNVEHLTDLSPGQEVGPEDVVKKETDLASFPDIYFKIKKVINTPTSSADDAAKVVGADVGLTAKLLKLVNSPFYGFSARIDSIPHAISLIGMKELSTLALGVTAVDFFKDIPPELIDMQAFWRHSISCGIFGKLVASRIEKKGAERFFTAGLLHDVGRLVLFKHMPYASTDALLFARGDTVPLLEAEENVLGYNHAYIARLLLQEWNFPSEVMDLIANHHSPAKAEKPRDAAVIQLADNLANAAGITAGGMFVLPGMTMDEWGLLGLDANVLDNIFDLHDQAIDDLSKTFTSK